MPIAVLDRCRGGTSLNAGVSNTLSPDRRRFVRRCRQCCQCCQVVRTFSPASRACPSSTDGAAIGVNRNVGARLSLRWPFSPPLRSRVAKRRTSYRGAAEARASITIAPRGGGRSGGPGGTSAATVRRCGGDWKPVRFPHGVPVPMKRVLPAWEPGGSERIIVSAPRSQSARIRIGRSPGHTTIDRLTTG